MNLNLGKKIKVWVILKGQKFTEKSNILHSRRSNGKDKKWEGIQVERNA